MRQRSTLCTHQMFALDLEPSDRCFHRDHGFTRNASPYLSRNSHPAFSGPSNSVDLFHQFGDHHETVMLHGNQYNIQNCHAFQNFGLGVAGPSNIYNSNMLLAPADRNFPVCQSNLMAERLPSTISQTDNGISMDEFSIHNHLLDDDRRLCKRKDTEMIPGIHNNLNGSSSSSSTITYHSNCGAPLWVQSYESVPGIMDTTSHTPSEFGRRTLPGGEVSHRSSRCISVTGSLQPESAVVPQQNCVLPGSYMIHPFQPTNNAWVSQFGNANNIVSGGVNWNYNNTLRYLQGRSLNTGRLHQANTNMQAYTGNSSATNSAMVLHPSSISNFHPAAHNVQVHGYSQHAHMPAPYQQPVNNLGSINSNLSGDGMDVASTTFPHFPSSVDQIYRPLQLPQPAQQFFTRSLRFLSAEDAAVMDLSGFYGVVNSIDQHEDMRLDIDDMSYEELLALEEQIGVVKTGLSEEFIIKHLKLRTHVPQETALSLEPSTLLSKENETCSICQVEYEEDEVIGSLDCGHAYHADCIKQWLLIKNLCPICKTSALDSKGRRQSRNEATA